MIFVKQWLFLSNYCFLEGPLDGEKEKQKCNIFFMETFHKTK